MLLWLYIWSERPQALLPLTATLFGYRFWYVTTVLLIVVTVEGSDMRKKNYLYQDVQHGKGWFTPKSHRNAVRLPVHFSMVKNFQPIGLKLLCIATTVVYALLFKSAPHQSTSVLQYHVIQCSQVFAICIWGVIKNTLTPTADRIPCVFWTRCRKCSQNAGFLHCILVWTSSSSSFLGTASGV